MITWSRRRTVLAGIALILTVNAVALAGVAYNRSGDPDSVLRLTQRELQLPFGWRGGAENSGIALTLLWRVPVREPADARGPVTEYAGSGGIPAWLDTAKLASLGFDVSAPKGAAHDLRRYDKQLTKEVLLVLELDGPAYRSALERARERAAREQALYAANAGNKEFEQRVKMAQDHSAREERENSRLFVVDAGLDAGTLRAGYPDRARYAIVRGQVRPQPISEGKEQRLAGYVGDLGIHQINVPLAFRQVFEHALGTNRTGPYDRSARYEAEVAFGKRLEPWITAASGKAGSE